MGLLLLGVGLSPAPAAPPLCSEQQILLAVTPALGRSHPKCSPQRFREGKELFEEMMWEKQPPSPGGDPPLGQRRLLGADSLSFLESSALSTLFINPVFFNS